MWWPSSGLWYMNQTCCLVTLASNGHRGVSGVIGADWNYLAYDSPDTVWHIFDVAGEVDVDSDY